MMKKVNGFLFLMMILLSVACTSQKQVTLYLIGDSTVQSGEGKGENQHWGWGSFFDQYFSIPVENHAKGGRSSRTFISEGRWDAVMNKLKPGDYLLMQFGHNDQSPLDDTARARGTIKGIAVDSVEIYNPILDKKEIVYTYGEYLRKYIEGAKQKKATIIVLSPVPRVRWTDGKIVSMDDYAGWAEAIAREQQVAYINLNKIVSDEYSKLGQDQVADFFPTDKTHTNEAGAKLIALLLSRSIGSENSNGLYKYKK